MMQLTPDQWLRVKETVASALELSPNAREAFVRREFKGDPDLLAEALSLLAHDNSSPPTVTDLKAGYLFQGAILNNRYVIHHKLEKGGFSSTFVASDQQLHDRRVVVKVLDGTGDDPYLARKFQEELAALSRL